MSSITMPRYCMVSVFGIILHSYVLMDNHYHLILETPNIGILPTFLVISSRIPFVSLFIWCRINFFSTACPISNKWTNINICFLTSLT